MEALLKNVFKILFMLFIRVLLTAGLVVTLTGSGSVLFYFLTSSQKICKSVITAALVAPSVS